MDSARILAQLAFQKPLPVEAIRAVEADREAAVPIFLRAIESYLSLEGDFVAAEALFLIFHLLGAWREKAAYQPMARLLSRPDEEIDAVLGDFFPVETGPRVMAAVFDGDPAPLYALVHDENVDEFIRGGMCEAIAIVTLQGELAREEAARFLRACYCELNPQDECWVWHGWQAAIAMLGLAELKPLVEEAFARGFIASSWLSFEHFETDLQRARDGQPPLPGSGDYRPFGGVIEELSKYGLLEPDEPKPEPATPSWKPPATRPWEPWAPAVPAVNMFKAVGRNDPCPCGSGKKFKKCCLNANADARNAA
jgi:hypothetical protein